MNIFSNFFVLIWNQILTAHNPLSFYSFVASYFQSRIGKLCQNPSWRLLESVPLQSNSLNWTFIWKLIWNGRRVVAPNRPGHSLLIALFFKLFSCGLWPCSVKFWNNTASWIDQSRYEKRKEEQFRPYVRSGQACRMLHTHLLIQLFVVTVEKFQPLFISFMYWVFLSLKKCKQKYFSCLEKVKEIEIEIISWKSSSLFSYFYEWECIKCEYDTLHSL